MPCPPGQRNKNVSRGIALCPASERVVARGRGVRAHGDGVSTGTVLVELATKFAP